MGKHPCPSSIPSAYVGTPPSRVAVGRDWDLKDVTDVVTVVEPLPWSVDVLVRKGSDQRDACSGERLCEERHGERWLSVSQGERSLEKAHLPAPWLQAARLQDWEKVSVCCRSPWSVMFGYGGAGTRERHPRLDG